MSSILQRLSTGVAGVAGVAVVASTLSAQTSARPSVGVFGGAAFPSGTFGDGFDTGYNVGAFIGFKPAIAPVGLRIEGAYNRFDLKNTVFGNTDIHTNIISGTANVVVGGSSATGTIRPYVIGGIGIYNSKDAGDGVSSASDTKFGVNGGAGLDLPLSGIGVFIEARYHYVFTKDDQQVNGFNVGFIPVVVGIRF